MEQQMFANICSNLKLGKLIKFERLQGGLTHRMFRVSTTTSDYAIKLLNPIIMARPDAYDNFTTAEMFEDKLECANIPIVKSLEFNSKKMQCCDGQYYYVFDWVDGKVLKSNEILAEHCDKIGGLLSKIHDIERADKNCNIDTLVINWNYYIIKGLEINAEVALILNENLKLLVSAVEDCNNSINLLPSSRCICHNDMDSKNVLWKGSRPYIIDLECLDYGNPYKELFELALSWSGFEHLSINFEMMESFILAYMKGRRNAEIDWNGISSTNLGRLKWLEYNLKRVLGECEYEEERQLGIEQINNTIGQLIYFTEIKKTLIQRLTVKFSSAFN